MATNYYRVAAPFTRISAGRAGDTHYLRLWTGGEKPAGLFVLAGKELWQVLDLLADRPHVVCRTSYGRERGLVLTAGDECDLDALGDQTQLISSSGWLTTLGEVRATVGRSRVIEEDEDGG